MAIKIVHLRQDCDCFCCMLLFPPDWICYFL